MAKLVSHLQALEKAKTALKVYQVRVSQRVRGTTQSHIDAVGTVLTTIESQRKDLQKELEDKGVKVSFSGADPLVAGKPNVRAWDLANGAARTINAGNALTPTEELKVEATDNMDAKTYGEYAQKQIAEVNNAIKDLKFAIDAIDRQLSSENKTANVTKSGTFGRESEAYEVLTNIKTELQGQVDKYNEQLVEIDKEVAYRNRLSKNTNDTITKLKSDLKNSQEEALLYKEHKDEVIEENQQKKETEVDMYKDIKDDLVEHVATIEQQNKNLVDQLALERQQSDENILDLSKQLKAAQKEADLYKEKAGAYEQLNAVEISKENESLKAENAELKQSLQTEKTQHNALKENYVALQTENTTLRSTIASMYKTFMDAVKSVLKSDKADAAVKEKVGEKLGSIATVLNKENNKIESYQEQIKTLETQNQALSAGLEKALGKEGPKPAVQKQAEAKEDKAEQQSWWQKLTK